MIYLILALFLNQSVQAQSSKGPFASDAEVLSQQGNLVAVKLVKGESIKLFVLGRQEAEVDLSDIKFDVEFDPSNLSLNIRRIDSKKIAQIVKFKREKNYFIIDNPDTNDKVYTLEVTTKVKGKKEVFNFKVENKLH